MGGEAVRQCNAMLCYAMLCYAMRCDAMRGTVRKMRWLFFAFRMHTVWACRVMQTPCVLYYPVYYTVYYEQFYWTGWYAYSLGEY